MDMNISAFDVCNLCTCSSGSLDTLLPPGLTAGSTKCQQDALKDNSPSSACLKLYVVTLHWWWFHSFPPYLQRISNLAPQVLLCCWGNGQGQGSAFVLGNPFQPHWGAQEGLAVVPNAPSPLCKSWGNQRRWAGIGVDTNLTNFSLSTPVFNYLLLLDSTSVYGKSDKTSLSFKNSVIEANLFVSQLKSKIHVLTRSGNDHHCFFKSWGGKCHYIWDTDWFRELATSCLVNAVLVMLPGANPCLKRFEALRLPC